MPTEPAPHERWQKALDDTHKLVCPDDYCFGFRIPPDMGLAEFFQPFIKEMNKILPSCLITNEEYEKKVRAGEIDDPWVLMEGYDAGRPVKVLPDGPNIGDPEEQGRAEEGGYVEQQPKEAEAENGSGHNERNTARF